MTVEEKREMIRMHCLKNGSCCYCSLNEFTRNNKTGCYEDVNDKTVEKNYNFLFGDTETTDKINTNQIKDLLYLQAQIDSAVREFANTILRGKQVSNEEIKDRISYIVNEEMRER